MRGFTQADDKKSKFSATKIAHPQMKVFSAICLWDGKMIFWIFFSLEVAKSGTHINMMEIRGVSSEQGNNDASGKKVNFNYQL